MSGPVAGDVAVALAGALPKARHAALRRLRDPRDGTEIDQAILLWFSGPRSATGEDLLEIHHHGGPAVREWLLDTLASFPGCRIAEPGEFAHRAFLAGKLDLTAVEGLADLVDARTRTQARQALRQLDGRLADILSAWRSQLLGALAQVEAEIDFGGDGEEVPAAKLDQEVSELVSEIKMHLADRRGERLRDGLTIAVTGSPNVGKSSLVNALARREVALVSEYPGTTRDVIEVQLEIAGIPVTLLDTAGLRETEDPVESLGIARARASAESADFELRLFVAGTYAPEEAAGTLLVATKQDLAPAAALPSSAVAISTLTGAGLAELLDRIEALAAPLAELASEPLITRARHRAALSEVVSSLSAFMALPGGELALRAEELRRAAHAVGRVTGAIGVEDVLGEIFARFCLGK